MLTVILVIHLLIAIAMIGTILLQRSEGGALGMGGGGGGGGGFMTGRSTANMLTRTTGVLAAAFMVTSLALSIMGNADRESTSILDKAEPAKAVEQPVEDKGPSAPIAK
ncbi:MAG: preprotein translocase subunit SecG [Rhodospirillales bacterium]|nr:preprotein translocase subunit SecG [Rhodospirillales bacterium]MCW8861078.1 preprotein translocase subunit SecG [Rhodospirillales bacterium]MCW8952102.1 preprotein translocase subunit SecG [Rhodospirillales bacterium]MCW8971136.1 preprotein translocase subunit SecG [Rhodospirillales bacterium]MCW9002875.1 preprotein translocase subunit SecG [Rhodospirillales bacterium]